MEHDLAKKIYGKEGFIETKRLLLRRFSYEDADAIFQNWANDPEVTKYLTWHPHQNVEVTKMVLDMWMKEYEKPNTYRFGITLKQSEELIGSIDVVDFIDGCPEIGYCLSRKHWNQGYMTEALKGFVDCLFEHGYQDIVIEADVRNMGSNKVIQKCGFVFTHDEDKEHNSPLKPEPVTVHWYKLSR